MKPVTFTTPNTCMYLNHFEVAGEHLTDPVPHPLISLFFCGYNDKHIQLLISIRVMTILNGLPCKFRGNSTCTKNRWESGITV